MGNKKEPGTPVCIAAYLITGFLVFSFTFNFIVNYGLPKIALLSKGRVLTAFLPKESEGNQENEEIKDGRILYPDFDSKNEINWEDYYPFTEEEKIRRNEILKAAEDKDKTDEKFFGYNIINDKEEGSFWKLGNRYYSLVSGIKGKIQVYFLFNTDKSKMFMLNNNLKRIAGTGTSSYDDGIVILMRNGFLTYAEKINSNAATGKIAERVCSFRDFLKENDIPFLYALTGSKVSPIDRQGMRGAEFTNENADALLLELEENDVDILDYRKEMLRLGTDWYDSYYKYDHHWKTTTGLWAAKILAERLNKDYGFDFSAYYFQNSSYDIKKYENFWLGGQGRKDYFDIEGLEDFELPIPGYDTDFSLTVPSENRIYRGSYKESLLDMEVIEKNSSYTKEEHLSEIDAYNTVRWRNQPLGNIVNYKGTNNEGKRILLIQDSFSWYLSTYLASDISYVDMIHPERFNGSIREYIRQSNPDIVVMILCSRNIKPEMFLSI